MLCDCVCECVCVSVIILITECNVNAESLVSNLAKKHS